jgi:hypothetical protein
MTYTYPAPNPSQTVERIREILVGRQLDRLEQRVNTLESGGSSFSVPMTGDVSERLLHTEARVEALQDSVQRLTRQEQEQNQNHQFRMEEVKRLAQQIQAVAAERPSHVDETQIVGRIEQRVGAWLQQWQQSLHAYLTEREQVLADQLRGETAQLWENLESQLTRLQSRQVDRSAIDERFRLIAEAARALAESAAPSTSSSMDAASSFTKPPVA